MSNAGAARPRLLNPSSTAAVILGAHDWSEAGLGRAPSFLRSAKRIIAYLYNRGGLGLDPELVLDLFDDTAAAGDQLSRIQDTFDEQLRERREAGHPVTDVLLYYIGHGHTDDQGHLSLLVRRSRRGNEAATGIRVPDLAQVLRRAAPQQRRSVVLDCCFSEAAATAFIGMPGNLDQAVAATAGKDLSDQPARGTLLLCSSPVGQVSIGVPDAECTLFTGAVLEVLQQGAAQGPPYLSFADLRDLAFDRMVVSFGSNAPRPALHQVNAAQGDLTRAPAFQNQATVGVGTRVLSDEWFRLGMLGRDDEAIAVYDRLIASFGDAPEWPLREQAAKALINKAARLSDLGRSLESTPVYNQLLHQFRNDPEIPLRQQIAQALFDEAVRLGTVDRNNEAIAVYDRLIDSFGGAPELPLREQAAKALLNKAARLSDLGRSLEIAAVYDQLLHQFRNDPETAPRQQIAQALFDEAVRLGTLGRDDAAIAVYDRLIASFGGAPE
jgi:tetratricopeptide (TPR) repeat protein